MARTLSELEKKIQEKIRKALDENVAKAVKEEQSKVILEEVYPIYPEPKRYQRTFGLSNPKNMEHEMIDDNTVAIRSHYIDRENNDKNVGYVVATGEGYDHTGYGYAYELPRPFPEWTKEKLKQSKVHIEALKEGLKGQGVKVK